MQKIWRIKKYDEKIADRLSEDLKVDKITAIILNIKGILNKEEGIKFLTPDPINDFHNPFLIKDMEKAVQRVRRAIDKEEHICIYGDRDVDGVSGAALLYKALKQCKAHVDVFVPEGDDGFGLNENIVSSFHQNSCDLIITVDNGITSISAVEKANEYNIDVIVIDHHTPEERLPDACAVINPKCEEKYPFKNLAGAGVAYKFIYSLFFSYTQYYNKEIVVLSLKTTGLNPGNDDIIEIGAVKLRNFVKIGEFQQFLKQSNPVSNEIKQEISVSDEELSLSKPVPVVIKEFYSFIEDCILVGHNINEFDMVFLRSCIRKYLNIDIKNETVDTLILSRKYLNLKENGLDIIASFFKIDVPVEFHRAYDNALIVAEVFKKFFRITKKIRQILNTFIEYAALGTLADVVTLTDENRLIAKNGIKELKNTGILGFHILLKKMGIDRATLTSKTMAWKVIPVLNAPGRMGKAGKSLQLLITEDENEAERIADELLLINEERKYKQEMIFNKIIDILDEKVDVQHDKIFIIDLENMDHGVTGVIANRLKDMYYRPVVVLIIIDGKGIGSARSIEQFEVYKAFKKCEDLFENFGGHKYAVGFTIKQEKIAELKNRLKKIADESIKAEDLIPVLEIDVEIDSGRLSIGLIKEIVRVFSPYGENNIEPLFLIKNLKLNNLFTIGANKKHLKLNIETASKHFFDALWWGGTEKDFHFVIGKNYDIVFKPEINVWNNIESISWIIEDMRLSK